MKVWLISQGASCTGRAVVSAALAAGDCVVATVRDRRALGGLQNSHVHRLRVAPMPTAAPESAEAVVDFTLEAFGRLDVLVNVALAVPKLPNCAAPPHESAVAVINLARAALLAMRWSGSPRVFNILAATDCTHRSGRAHCSATGPEWPGVSDDPARGLEPLNLTTIWVQPGARGSHFRAEMAEEIVRRTRRSPAFGTA